MSPVEAKQSFISIAEGLKPTLRETQELPLSVVRFEPNDSFLRYQAVVASKGSALAMAWFSRGDSVIVDFGTHRTGYLSFFLAAQGNVDSPARLRLTFGEVPSDVTEDLYPSKSWITTAWIPYEIITVDDMFTEIYVPRRHAFRYVKIEVMEMSQKFKVGFQDMAVKAVSSAQIDVEPLSDPAISAMDAVGLRTLRDCMQTVFEDGPRRDRRLWLGDLRLQALVNYVTFKNHDLVKRCLYLFAALRSEGRVMACVYERPKPHTGGEYIPDYELLYVVTLLEYVQHSGDMDTGRDLFPLCQEILQRNRAEYIRSGLFTPKPDVWFFIDWHNDLHRTACMQAVFLFAFKAAEKLAGILDLSVHFSETIEELAQGALTFYDAEKGVFVCDGQVSWATQAWMGLARVLTPGDHVRAIQLSVTDPEAVKPNTPYCFHYVLEALHTNGAVEECLRMAKVYFGGMVERGADTYWEAYDEHDSRFSPYDDYHNNSYCHAWSCTISWFLRFDAEVEGNRHRHVSGVRRSDFEEFLEDDERWTEDNLPHKSERGLSRFLKIISAKNTSIDTERPQSVRAPYGAFADIPVTPKPSKSASYQTYLNSRPVRAPSDGNLVFDQIDTISLQTVTKNPVDEPAMVEVQPWAEPLENNQVKEVRRRYSLYSTFGNRLSADSVYSVNEAPVANAFLPGDEDTEFQDLGDDLSIRAMNYPDDMDIQYSKGISGGVDGIILEEEDGLAGSESLQDSGQNSDGANIDDGNASISSDSDPADEDDDDIFVDAMDGHLSPSISSDIQASMKDTEVEPATLLPEDDVKVQQAVVDPLASGADIQRTLSLGKRRSSGAEQFLHYSTDISKSAKRRSAENANSSPTRSKRQSTHDRTTDTLTKRLSGGHYGSAGGLIISTLPNSKRRSMGPAELINSASSPDGFRSFSWERSYGGEQDGSKSDTAGKRRSGYQSRRRSRNIPSNRWSTNLEDLQGLGETFLLMEGLNAAEREQQRAPSPLHSVVNADTKEEELLSHAEEDMPMVESAEKVVEGAQPLGERIPSATVMSPSTHLPAQDVSLSPSHSSQQPSIRTRTPSPNPPPSLGEEAIDDTPFSQSIHEEFSKLHLDVVDSLFLKKIEPTEDKLRPPRSSQPAGQDELVASTELEKAAKVAQLCWSGGHEEFTRGNGIAQYLGQDNEFNRMVLRAYMKYFNFRRLRVDLAFRRLCQKLYFKAESQEIDRILQGFAERYLECNPNCIFGDTDTVHAVSYSLLLLNTDLHVVTGNNKMTRSAFIRNTMHTIMAQRGERNGEQASTLSPESHPKKVHRRRSIRDRKIDDGDPLSRPEDHELHAQLREIYSAIKNEQILQPITNRHNPRISIVHTNSAPEISNWDEDKGKASESESIGRMGALKRGVGSIVKRPMSMINPDTTHDIAPHRRIQSDQSGNPSSRFASRSSSESPYLEPLSRNGRSLDLNPSSTPNLSTDSRPPFHKEGFVVRKHLLEGAGVKAKHREWKECYLVVDQGSLKMFALDTGMREAGNRRSILRSHTASSLTSTGKLSSGMMAGQLMAEIELHHTLSNALPPPGYNRQRPFVFVVQQPNGGVYLFQVPVQSQIKDWVSTCNYWAARSSKEPLAGGVSNMEYGWSTDLDREEGLGLLNAPQPDNKQVYEWRPPVPPTIPSTLSEEEQLAALTEYVHTTGHAMDEHTTLKQRVQSRYPPRHPAHARALQNWENKLQYLLHEFIKYQNYCDIIEKAVALRATETESQKHNVRFSEDVEDKSNSPTSGTSSKARLRLALSTISTIAEDEAIQQIVRQY
ncbi:hypothetical protein BZG36_05033 [Bifiguratus adelaidae]|uniref:SEC7 domain-containing protein n=1 Tax=Bifiguratus adelaidae TaxID=1938954 RepID=A0A261XV48_9FUNG|nr:hypothetical protein BZG36_05033 [Bifiguratus adelaidae]